MQKYSVKFIYSEKSTKFCEISTVDLSYVVPVKSTVEISQKFVAFSEYMNFITDSVRFLVNIFEVKKAFCYQKLFWPFTVRTNCSSDFLDH